MFPELVGPLLAPSILFNWFSANFPLGACAKNQLFISVIIVLWDFVKAFCNSLRIIRRRSLFIEKEIGISVMQFCVHFMFGVHNKARTCVNNFERWLYHMRHTIEHCTKTNFIGWTYLPMNNIHHMTKTCWYNIFTLYFETRKLKYL